MRAVKTERVRVKECLARELRSAKHDKGTVARDPVDSPSASGGSASSGLGADSGAASTGVTAAQLVYLPAAVRQQVIGYVPNPTLTDSKIVQFYRSGDSGRLPYKHLLRLIHSDSRRVIAVEAIAEREPSAFDAPAAARAALDQVPWRVSVFRAEFGQAELPGSSRQIRR